MRALAAAGLRILGPLVLFLPGVAWGAPQDEPKDLTLIPLEELGKVQVISASKFSQKASQAPASITIITAADIHRNGFRNFDDILRSVPGFYVTYDRNYSYAGTRGFGLTGDYNSHLLFLINGHRLNDNVYGSTGIGTEFPVSLDLIDRIEVVRGPGSSLYGTNAFFGVINVITKRGRTFEGPAGSVEAGSQGTYQGNAVFGQRYTSGLDVVVSAEFLNSKGYRRLYFPEFDTPGSNNGVAEDADTGKAVKAFANVSYGDFSFQASYVSRDKRIPTAAFDTVFDDRRTATTDKTAFLDAKYERTFRDVWRLLARSSVDGYDYVGRYASNYGSDEEPDYDINKDIVSGRWLSGEVQLTRSVAGRHHLTGGTEWRRSFRGNQQNFDEYGGSLYLDSRQKINDLAAYLQAELAARDNLLFSLGVRRDHDSEFGGVTNPRLGVVYSPWKQTTAKLLYGRAFRAPNLYEMFYADSISSKANPDLLPERITIGEFVVEQLFRERFRLAGSLYRYRVNQKIVQSTDMLDGMIYFENLGRVNARGMELELEAKDVAGFDGLVSYSLQRTLDPLSRRALSNSPRHLLRLALYRPWGSSRLGTGFDASYMSSRWTLADSSVGGFALVNVTMHYSRLLPGVDFSAGLYNVFDRRYADPGGMEHRQDSIVQNGRTFRIRLSHGIPER
jgi:outer membrane receptor for ferrienterochelin and colicins